MNLNVSKDKKSAVILIWLLITTALSAYGFITPREIQYALSAAEIIAALKDNPEEVGTAVINALESLPTEQITRILQIVLNSSFSLLQKEASAIISKVASYTCWQDGTDARLKSYSTNADNIFDWMLGNCSGGEKIFVRNGTYSGITLTLKKHGIRLDAQSPENTIIQGDGANDIIILDEPDGESELRDVEILNLQIQNPTISAGGCLITNALGSNPLNRFRVEGCDLNNIPSGKHALNLTNPQMTDVIRNRIRSLNDDSIGILISSYNHAAGPIYVDYNDFAVGAGKNNVTFVMVTGSGTSGQVKRVFPTKNHLWADTTSTNVTGFLIEAGSVGDPYEFYGFSDNTYENLKISINFQGHSSNVIRMCDVINDKFYDSKTTVEAGQTFVKLNQHTRANRIGFCELRPKANSHAIGIDDDCANAAMPNEITHSTFINFDNTSVTIQHTAKTRISHNIGFVTENFGSSTGTGEEQTIPHGLAGTPTYVFLSPPATNAYESSSADGTNIYVTADVGEDYHYHVIQNP